MLGAPLHEAMRFGTGSEVLAMLNDGHWADQPDGGETPLHLAMERGHPGITALLIDGNANVDRRDSEGRTPLHCAAIQGDKASALLPLDAGADRNAWDDSGHDGAGPRPAHGSSAGRVPRRRRATDQDAALAAHHARSGTDRSGSRRNNATLG